MMTGGDCDGFKCALCSQRMEWETIDTEEDFLLLADKQFPKNKQLEIAFERYGWEWTRKQILKKYPEGEHYIVGNWEQVKQRPQFRELGGDLGNCQIIQGDARQLTSLCFNVKQNDTDCIISSPPFQEPDIRRRGMDKSRESYDYGNKLKMSSEHPDNISRLAERNYGDIDGLVDKCIFSPPFGEAMSGGGIARYGHYSDPELAQRAYSAENMNIKKQIKRVEEGKAKMQRPDVFTSEGNKAAKGFFEGNYSRDPSNIGNLPYGQIDKIVTSPPHGDSLTAKRKGYTKLENLADTRQYPENPNNLGNFPYGNIDSIITSPPYEEAHSNKNLGVGDADRADLRAYSYLKTETKGQIGNLKSDSYLEAMLQVYQQCRKCLKPQGLMILVTKNFIREKQVVRLDSDTIKLCEQAGFSFVERHYRKLPAQSFWRTIYHQKHPEVEQIKFEDILVFQRSKG